ncbi:MAG: hypothetical protein ACYSU0_15860 [Planctomycetota bacterium]|jgi:hypothetical protein
MRPGPVTLPKNAGRFGLPLAAAAVGCILAGCGRQGYTGVEAEEAAAMKRVAALKFPKLTKTAEELGVTYPEKAWETVSTPFEPKYLQLTEYDVFGWGYLKELSLRRQGILRRSKKEQAALARKALAKQKKESKKRKKAQAKTDAKAKHEKALEAAERGEPVSTAEDTPAEP